MLSLVWKSHPFSGMEFFVDLCGSHGHFAYPTHGDWYGNHIHVPSGNSWLFSVGVRFVWMGGAYRMDLD